MKLETLENKDLEQVNGGMMTHLDRLRMAEQARKEEEARRNAANEPGGATGTW